MPASPKEAALRGFLEGGVHIDLCSLLYLRYLPELVEEGRISEERAPGAGGGDAGGEGERRRARRPAARDRPRPRGAAPRRPGTAYRELARASVVLLRPVRPDPSVLPIPADARVCVLGPLADQDPEDWLGAYSSHGNRHLERVTTPLAGHPAALAGGAPMRGAATMRPRTRGRSRRRRRRLRGRRMSSLPRRAARVERGVGDAGRPAAAGGAAAAGRAVRRANAGGEARRLRHGGAGAARSARGRGERRRDLLDGARGQLRGDAIGDILAGVASPTARLSHGLPMADGITSGFDTRQARIDRPAVPVVAGSAARRQRHHWCAYYLGLGARWPAGYYFGEGYSYTTFALSDWSLSGALSARRARRSTPACG